MLRDIDVESRELTDLVNELVELATDRSSTDEEPEMVDLAELAQTVAARAQRPHRPGDHRRPFGPDSHG